MTDAEKALQAAFPFIRVVVFTQHDTLTASEMWALPTVTQAMKWIERASAALAEYRANGGKLAWAESYQDRVDRVIASIPYYEQADRARERMSKPVPPDPNERPRRMTATTGVTDATRPLPANVTAFPGSAGHAPALVVADEHDTEQSELPF